MYASTLLASVAVLASTALAGTPGDAVIVNGCTYPVYLSAVPSADGGYQESSHTLQPKDTWTQTWTQLSNGNGWSLKLSKGASIDNSNVLQYEYTYQNDGTIWYDLSAVNGNPWDSNWQISSLSPGCTPKHSWYRNSTDDQFGMQDCPDGSSITVTLCSAESQADSVVSQVAAGFTSIVGGLLGAATTAQTQPTTTTQAQPTTTAHTEPTTTATQAAPAVTSAHGLGYNNGHFNNKAVEAESPSPTTFATSRTAAVVDSDGHVVTEIVTVVETAIAYETYVPGKRHVHHPNHPHFR